MPDLCSKRLFLTPTLNSLRNVLLGTLWHINRLDPLAWPWDYNYLIMTFVDAASRRYDPEDTVL